MGVLNPETPRPLQRGESWILSFAFPCNSHCTATQFVEKLSLRNYVVKSSADYKAF